MKQTHFISQSSAATPVHPDRHYVTSRGSILDGPYFTAAQAASRRREYIQTSGLDPAVLSVHTGRELCRMYPESCYLASEHHS